MDFLFHNSYLNHDEKRRNARLLACSVSISLFFYFIFLGTVIYVGFKEAKILIIGAIFTSVVSLGMLKTGLKLKIPGNLSIIGTNILAFSCMAMSGGIHSPLVIWIIVAPITTLLILNRRTSYFWVAISLLELGLLVLFDLKGIVFSSSYNSAYHDFFYISSFSGVMVVMLVVSLLFKKSIEESQHSVENLNRELLMKNEELNIQTEEIVSQRDMLFDMTREMDSHQGEVLQLNEQLEARIKSRTNELFHALEELDTFIYRSAHDIKGPLATISGLCYVAMFDVKDEKSAGYLAKIQIQTQKTIQLLQRISGISELKKTKPSSSVIDFKLIQLKLSRYMQEEEDTHFVNITIRLPTIDTEFWSDQNLLEMMVVDLLDNSIKFRDSFKDVKPYALLEMLSVGENLRIKIEDNGLGVHESIKATIFDMFFKGSDKSKGSGLGLFIVKVAVEKLNGTIMLNTSIKGKTIFCIDIPCLKAGRIEI